MLDKTRVSLTEAMRRFAMSISIISTSDDKGQHYAMTATAVVSVSLNPESMLVCVNKNTLFSSVATGADKFAVNLLASDQISQSKDCAGGLPQDSRVNNKEWEVHDTGVAILKGAQTHILCRKSKMFEYGTHTILIGDVYNILVNKTIDTLIYMDGKYGKFKELK
ncbi:MAG: 4-hydroxyphenylacetate 3-monooxygenase [Gammaproteobacteria bacterium]|nr:4-hydroxyphenylacetate 3-monooxygenase [Gammaproteobacteria bacterium]